MLSRMETDDRATPRPGDDLLRTADRAAAAPYIDYPEPPWWYPPAAGLWFAAIVSLTGDVVTDNPVVRGVALAALIAILGVAVQRYRRIRGVMPATSPRHAPPEIRREMYAYLIAAAVVVTVVLATASTRPTAAPPVTFVLATGGLALYEGRYRRAAGKVRERLG